MALNLATFRTRTLSALIFVVVMGVGLLWNLWAFLALFSLIHFGCWWEYQRLMGKIDPAYSRIPTLWRFGFPLFGWGGMWWSISIYAGSGIMGAGLVLILVGAFRKEAGHNVWYALAGLLYISLPWSVMVLIRGIGESVLSIASLMGEPSLYQRIVVPAALPCTLVFSIWINDTMAYIVGSFIGKTPFSPISPKKTWEGTLGGAILCVGVMTFLGYHYGPAIGLYATKTFIGISAICAIAGTAGDLLESKLKRMAGVKDSGHILPGHGGFLDRFDSMLLATPFVYVFLLLGGLS